MGDTKVLITFVTVPRTNLTVAQNWRDLGGRRRAALRLHLLLKCMVDQNSLLGPIEEVFNVGDGTEAQIKRKHSRIISKTGTISEAITYTTTSRLVDNLAGKLTAGMSAGVPGLGSGKLGAELLANSQAELTEALQSQLVGTSSHYFQELDEREYTLTLRSPDGKPREAHLRRRYHAYRWDIYLHSYDYMELEYRNTLGVLQVRNVTRTLSEQFGIPVCSIKFFEPHQADYVATYGSQPGAIANPDAIEVLPLTDAMPTGHMPSVTELREVARLAFPESRAEKAATKRHRIEMERPAAAGDGEGEARKRPTKKAKKAAKKSAKKVVKKFAKRAAKKKTAKKAAKKAAKRTARKAAKKLT